MRFFSDLVFLTILASVSASLIEAETGTLTGGCVVASDLPGYTGTGYVSGFETANDTLTVSVAGLTAGSYDLTFRYSAQYGDKYTTLSVNGASGVEISLPNITSLTWTTSTASSFALTADTNTFEFTVDWGWYFIDSLTLLPTPAKPIVVVDVTNGAVVEAENGIFTGGVTVGTATPGYSGTGFVQGFAAAGDSDTLTISSATEALYDVVVRYAAIYGGKQTTMVLNGGSGAEVVLADTTAAASSWANATAGQVLLNAGNNTIAFNDDWGWYFIDCLYITPAPAPAPHNVEKTLVDAKALPVTVALYKKLLSKYGSGDIFSGQATLEDVEWLTANVGQTPAIVGLDMIDYSPSRVEYQGNVSTQVEDGISFDGEGGIVAFQWHWNAPTDLINNATVPWWDGIYTYGTTFNLTAALADPTGSDYALLLSDMDAIAYQLARLQTADIPIIWRPLHEADGGWFWWGAWGPKSCITLYRLMYDRYTNYHSLHNLIWLWNSVTPSWYPGSDVVDILGYDSYPAIGDHGPVDAQYVDLIALGNDTKIVTLPEVGNIPDPAILKLYHVDWSYFVTWSGAYIENDTYNDLAFKKQVYNDPTVLKLSDLGNWKGTSTIVSQTSSSSRKSTSTSTGSAPAATQSKYGQCGGAGYSGPTVCAVGTMCTLSNAYYSQCL